MREILFRGKRKDNGEWVEGYYAIQSNHACFANELRYQHFIFKDIFLDFNLGGLQEFEVIPETVGQYTGLTDKNGKKIFEGDILKHRVQGDILVERGVVEWEEQHGRWVYRLNSMKPTFYLHNPDAFEVIGNIHDNPELLKGGDENDT